MLSRLKKYGVVKILSLTMIVAATIFGAYAVFGGLTESQIVKLNPVAVSADSSGAWVEDSTAWALFDRDTATAYTPAASPSRIMVNLPLATEIVSIKVYGPASYDLTVYDGSSGSWVAVPGLQSIALQAQAVAWNIFKSSSSVKTNKLMLEFSAFSGNAGGIKEIEIWGSDPGDPGLSLKGIKTPADAKNVLISYPRPAHIIDLVGAPQTIDVPADSNSYTINFTLGTDPRLVKRAYLVYDSYNAVYPVSPEKRINGLSWTGGFVPTSSDPIWTSHIEEINPAWLLKGANAVEFRNQVAGREPASYFIRDLKIVAELENGWNALTAVSGIAENANHSAQAAFDGDVTTYFELKSTHTLDLKAERTVQPDMVRINLWSASGTPSGTITLQYLQGVQWKNFASGGTVDLSTLKSGWNDIKMPAAVATDTIRLTIQVTPDKKRQGAIMGGINEVELTASPIGSRTSLGLLLNYPLSGEYFARTAYLQGFIDPASNAAGSATISIEGKSVSNADGSFSIALTKDETRFASQNDDDAWEAVVTATRPDGTNLSQTVALNKNLLNNSPSSTDNSSQASMSMREKFSEKVSPGQAKKIQYKGVTLDIPEGAVDRETEITIIPLTEADLARLNPGMINVTFPDAGYRFLPHGMKFKKPIKISFGYSKTLFAAGQVDDEVTMYFYDESLLRWQKLSRFKVDPAVSQVTSESDHFTDIINSTLVVPEHPQALSFNPNSIKDIKAADPSANINLIEPPSANNKGTVNLSYPIEVPPGRNKLQPSLAVQYNSSGGNGWTGVGWDVSMPSISIDTRFGAPVYDETKRTETYLLNGQQMVLAPNGEYRLRVEGAFSRIVRHGEGPGAYWWVVTDKSGTRYVYGGDESAQLTDGSWVFTWYLSRIVDTNGNTVDYIYTPKNQETHNGGESATYTYISEIRYTGNAGKGKPDEQIRNVPAAGTGSYYKISFIHDTVNRPDAIVDGRPGFKTVLDERLKWIVEDVVLNTGTMRIRKYEFNYKPVSDFDKSMLESVVQYGSDDNVEFNRHSFEYYGMPTTSDGYDAFEPVQSWSIPSIDGGLSLTKNNDKHVGIYLGFMLYTDALHIGAGWGWGEGKSDTELLTLDLNGDGLSDFLQKGGYYKNNWNTDTMMGSAFNQTGLDSPELNTLGKEENKEKSFDVGLHIGKHDGQGSAWKKISITRGKTRTEIKGNAIMADINGDGLVDQLSISGGTLMVRLNNGNGFGDAFNWAGGVNIEPELTADQRQALLDEYPLMDPVRAWKAPFNGAVSISGTVAKPSASDIDKDEDGVKIAVYKGISVTPLWEKIFLQAESVDLSGIAALQGLSVDRGEQIYVKVSSIEDSNNDLLNTDITVSYSSISGYENNIINDPRFDQTVTGEPVFSSNTNSAFAMAAIAPKSLGNNPLGTWMAPYKGKIRLTNTIAKLMSSEDLRFRLTQIDENDKGEVISTNALLDQVVSAATATAINQVLEDLEIAADTKLIFDISSPKLGTVRSDRVIWTPEVQYTHICTRKRSGVDIDDPATFTPEDDQSADDYLNEEVCKDLTHEEQDMTDRDLPGAVPPEDGTPPVKLFLFKPTPVLNVYPFKRLKPMEAWVAPRAGTVRIVTHSHKLAETSSELHLKIQTTNELISQYTYSTDQIRQINQPPLSVIDVPVTEGQRLFFDIVSKDAISPETVTIPDPAGGEGNPTIDVPSVAWDHEILYVDSPHCYTDSSTNTETCVTVDKKFTNNQYNYYQYNQYNNTVWTMHFDELCLATDRCVVVDCTGNRQTGAPISLAAASCQTTEYVPNSDPEQPPVLVHKQVTQAERAATGLDRNEYFVPVVNRDSLEWREDDRSPLFGFYRDWAYVVWNGNKTWNTALLVVPDTVPEPVDPMNPTDEELDRIQPPDFWQAKPFAFGSNRYPDVPLWSAGGFDYLSMNETMPFRAGGNITPFIKVPAGAGIANLRKTKNEQTKTSLGVGPLGASKSNGPAKTELDLVDMNGDRYPDQVSNGSIVFNRGIGGGGFDTEAKPVSMGIQGEGALRRTDSKSVSLSFGAGSLITEANSSGKQVKSKSTIPTIGTGYGSSRTVVELMDINGDGLPDRVKRDGGNIVVRLNLGGNRFGAEESWTADGWSVSDISRLGKLGSVSPNAVRATDTVSANISSGSASLGVNGSRTIVDLADINGDGLPDLVMKEHGKDYMIVRINQGNSFGSEKRWYVPGWGTTIGRGATATLYGGNDVLGYNEGWTLSGGLNFTIHFRVTIAFIVIHIFIEPDANISTGQGSSSLALMDVNGDGMPDQIYRANASIGGSGSGEVRIKYNKVGKTNLLKTVKRPLGGKISLDYERRGNEVEETSLIDMPHSQWVMTSVNLTDGRGSSYATTCDYGKGYYSRSEREFYGFDSVIETHAPGTPLQRTTTQIFDNHDYYLRNMAKKSVTTDNNGNAWARTINTFDKAPVKVMRGQGIGGTIVAGAIFPKLFQTDTYFYTGSTNENSYSKSTAQQFIYDDYGNVTKFTDFADNGGADDTNADIGYWTVDTASSYMAKPSSIIVTGQSSNDVYRERSSVYESGTGNLTQLTMSIAQSGSTPAVWDMSYDSSNGNLTTIKYPSGDPNFNKMNNAQYFVEYSYDTELAIYAASITDTFGYTSEAGYQYEYGLPKWQKDINGNYQVNVYDIFGRMSKVYGPCDTNSQNEPSGVPTLAFGYRAPVLVPNDSDTDEVNDNYAGTPARAVTSNKASACSGQTPLPSQIIATATFVDGMKRVIQTQKDAEVNGQPVVIVSGQVVYDNLGRVKEQDQPATNASKAYDLVSSVTRKGTTQFFYDNLDRTTRVIAPDGATTQTFYGFGGLTGVGDNLFLTQVVDPMDRSKESYKDVRDRIHAVVEHNTVDGAAVNIVTRYTYDAIGQITRVTDVRNNITSVTYDRLGRRLTINNPDTGLTSYTYDANGNVTTKETANLKTGGKLIKYQYEYNRLKEIEYPDTPHVVYEYGSPTDLADNQAGRIKKVTDESGEEERYYGRLGEVVKEKRRINAFNNPVSQTWYETRYVFDSFGRMREMIYPDGEVLQYTYDSGGLLYHAEGTKRANRYVYVDKLRYDEFGQRTRIEYGNGVYTKYTYDDATRRLTNLYTVALDNKATRVIQNIDYNYDLVGNILYTDNTDVPFPPGGMQGGKTRQDYTYDDLYQLTTANGWFQSAANKKTTYVNNFYYNIIGNITNKVQTHLVVHGDDPLTDSSTNPRETNYNLNYQYMTGGSAKPHAVTETEDKLYKYDDNGNMTDWISKVSGQNRHLNWNEENRVKSILDQGSTVVFLYDDSGERAVKRGQMGESVYVNRFYSLKNGGLGSKHIFAGETRVVTKLEKDGGNLSTGIPGSIALTNSNGIDNGLARGNGTKRGINRRLPNPDGTSNTTNPPLEKFEFFYHGDHLGSSSFITDDAGAVYQHLEYFPYGETWVEEGGTGQMSMYRFTGKELDPETGLYYYGARYYDPVLSRWISADPALEDYIPNKLDRGQSGSDWDPEVDLPGYGGIFRSANLNLFGYTINNPIVFKDLDGNSAIFIEVTRKVSTNKSTVGTITVNSKSFGVTLELPFKGNKKNVSSIPVGTHFARFFSSKKHPNTIEIIVQGRSEVLVHSGNIPLHTHGCVLVGTCAAKGKSDKIEQSKDAVSNMLDFIHKVQAWDRAIDEPTDIIFTVKDAPGPMPTPSKAQTGSKAPSPSRRTGTGISTQPTLKTSQTSPSAM